MVEKPLTKHDVKNSVFLDLFHFPQYQLQLFQALHPDVKKIKEKDLKTMTLDSVIVNRVYNDLALLVKDRLLIFVEHQSTWTANLLIRLLIYLAMTYKDLIDENDWNIYGSKLLDFPKPEFYIIYTGKRRFKKDVISLRDDYFGDPNLPIDIQAKVIYSAEKQNIIGQFITFCHVLDANIKKHGRTRLAVMEALRICRDKDVLNEYLQTREKEVIDIMITLFDQEFATKAHTRSENIRTAVNMCRRLGVTKDVALQNIVAEFNIPLREAKSFIKEYWGKKGVGDNI